MFSLLLNTWRAWGTKDFCRYLLRLLWQTFPGYWVRPCNGVSAHEEATASTCAFLAQCRSETNSHPNLHCTTQANIFTDATKTRVSETWVEGDLSPAYYPLSHTTALPSALNKWVQGQRHLGGPRVTLLVTEEDNRYMRTPFRPECKRGGNRHRQDPASLARPQDPEVWTYHGPWGPSLFL